MMGQRLNIEIHSGKDNLLANAYYHWSGYTRSSIELTKMILENMEQVKEDNPTLRAVALLGLTGAHLTAEEIVHAKAIKPDGEWTPASSRNAGLVAISKKGTDETRRWEEARVTIDLEDQTVTFDSFSRYTEEEFEEYYSKLELEQMQPWAHDLVPFEPMPFDGVAAFSDYVSEAIDNASYNLKLTKGEETTVIGFIE
jgi:hypothetical protein